MAKRQRVRAARAQRRSTREAERATVEKLMEQFRGRLTNAETMLEAENELLIHKARMAGNRRALILRRAAARLAKARATGYLRGQTLSTPVAARADAA